MAEEDFEIDVYGDAEGGQDQDQGAQEHHHNDPADDQNQDTDRGDQNGSGNEYGDHNGDHNGDQNGDDYGMDGQNDDQPAPQQGVKRKQEESDDRPIDQGATTALLLSEMQWWVTEDEIRGWTRDADGEDELKDITFSEHKVNGKSKG